MEGGRERKKEKDRDREMWRCWQRKRRLGDNSIMPARSTYFAGLPSIDRRANRQWGFDRLLPLPAPFQLVRAFFSSRVTAFRGTSSRDCLWLVHFWEKRGVRGEGNKGGIDNQQERLSSPPICSTHSLVHAQQQVNNRRVGQLGICTT